MIAPAPRLRLDRNERPRSASRQVASAIGTATATVHRYPDSDCGELRCALAIHHGVEPDMVLVVNGTAEAVLVIAMAYRQPAAVLTTRTWPVYADVVARLDVAIRWVAMPSYRLPARRFARALLAPFGSAFVCNPHNPCGTSLDHGEIADIFEAAEAGGGALVLDEAYAEYARPGFASGVDLLRAGRDCLVLKTFSKAYGLAGLRVAYVLAPAARISRLNAYRALYTVGAVGQAAALAALRDGTAEQAMAANERARSFALSELRGLGFDCQPSDTNFLLLRVGCDSASLARQLMDECGIAVVDGTALGFPDHLRVGIGTVDEMRTFCAALASLACPAGRGRECSYTSS